MLPAAASMNVLTKRSFYDKTVNTKLEGYLGLRREERAAFVESFSHIKQQISKIWLVQIVMLVL